MTPEQLAIKNVGKQVRNTFQVGLFFSLSSSSLYITVISHVLALITVLGYFQDKKILDLLNQAPKRTSSRNVKRSDIPRFPGFFSHRIPNGIWKNTWMY